MPGSIGWDQTVRVPDGYRDRGSHIHETALRGITLKQINELAELVQDIVRNVRLPVLALDERGVGAITWDNINMYYLNDYIVKPLTHNFKCSFVELVAEEAEPQTPRWFVSHFWGTPFKQTAGLLNFHAAQRRLPPDTAYWICTFAINQHDLTELNCTMEETPFWRALMLPGCVGTVALFDSDVTTFRRSWCVLENYVSTQRKSGHLYDVAAWVPEGTWVCADGSSPPAQPALRLDQGSGRYDERTEGCAGLPAKIDILGAETDILSAKASRSDDRRNILRMIAGTPHDENPPSEHHEYDRVNAGARAIFAGAAMSRAAYLDDTARLTKLLCEFGSLRNHQRYDGATPVYMAAWKGHATALRLLLESAACPNMAQKEGITPVFIASHLGNAEALQLLLAARANPDTAQNDGIMPVYVAAQNGRVDALRLLLDARARPDAFDDDGTTAVYISAELGCTDVLRLLLEAMASAGLACADGHTPVYVAASTGQATALQLLLRAKACPDVAVQDGPTPAFIVAQQGHVETMTLLLRADADTSVPFQGWTPLRIAAIKGHAAIVQLLEVHACAVTL